jgi:two-component system, OmpR family, response regulator CpxR
MRILVIDDDVELASLLGEFLRREGFDTDFAHDGAKGLETALRGGYALVVLDVMLPGLDGFEVLRRLRQSSRIPVVMLTARGEDVDRIVGLELGADDYLAKPFNPRELAARIRAVLRRTEPRHQDGVIEVNGVSLDPSAREVSCDGSRVDLTTIEFDILEQLMRAAGRVLTRDQLMEAIYGRKSGPFDRAMDMHISHLRKKLECGGRALIKTVRGVGYQFVR